MLGLQNFLHFPLLLLWHFFVLFNTCKTILVLCLCVELFLTSICLHSEAKDLMAFVRLSWCHLSVNYCKQAELINAFPIVAKCHSWWETLKEFEKKYIIDKHLSYHHDNGKVFDDRKHYYNLCLADICVIQPWLQYTVLHLPLLLNVTMLIIWWNSVHLHSNFNSILDRGNITFLKLWFWFI